MSEGMMRMRQIDSINIAANAQVKLQPSGLHLMVFDLKQPLKDSQTITMTLHFAELIATEAVNATPADLNLINVNVELPVRSIKKKHAHHHHH